jgi:hypothetical protein
MVIARLNDRAQPMDRGELYEDPLDEVLKARGLGAVTGGGTQLGEGNEIEFCDVEIEVTGAVESALDVIAKTLDGLGAPIGSRLLVDGNDAEIPFGRTQGLAVYLNGTDLPDEVYRDCDVDFVVDEFKRLLGDDGRIHSFWEGERETALYVYGPSFAAMRAKLAPFIDSYPLCRKARITQIA